MVSVNNPAGRLYSLLIAYSEARAANEGADPSAVWAKVFGTTPDKLDVDLARSATIIVAVAEAAERSGRRGATGLVRQHLREWSAPFLFPATGAGQGMTGSAGTINNVALTALDSLSEILELAAPDGREVTSDEALELRGQLDELRTQVVEDASLPGDIKALILHRLDDIAHALDQLAVLGPGAVAAATDRLIAAIVLQFDAEPNPDPAVRERLELLWVFTKKVYAVVAVSANVSGAAVGLGAAAKALGIGG